MAIREIREKGDEILYKKCKAVVKFDEKLHILLDDMYETMQSRDGVGLAAPQVGILKRAVVIDVGDGKIELINPEIVEESGEQTGSEGCLSVPGVFGEVTRPNVVTVKKHRTGTASGLKSQVRNSWQELFVTKLNTLTVNCSWTE